MSSPDYLPLPDGADITAIDQDPRQTMDAVIESCDRYDFAVVRSILSDVELVPVVEETDAFLARTDPVALDRWRQDHRDGNLSRIGFGEEISQYPHTNTAANDIRRQLSDAAVRLQSERIDVGIPTYFRILSINDYPVDGVIKEHIDNHDGIAFALGIKGIGRALLAKTAYETIETLISPGDLLVLPARVRQYRGDGHQMRHKIYNITPDKGHRTSLVGLYDGPENGVVRTAGSLLSRIWRRR